MPLSLSSLMVASSTPAVGATTFSNRLLYQVECLLFNDPTSLYNLDLKTV